MIFFNLHEILKKENMSQNKFSKISGVRPNTINNICNNNLKRFELATLEKIMAVLFPMGYKIEDVITYKDR
ncbi:helix-turn-helix domain-containing protein [Staphylococcus muscae]|uniref:Helix-turn-helix n=1 Tax=Staphylococcus muscae TaxID=1294 RepID=A0A240BR45_9STAP|nr:helix-turn-helix domain-containing protein [Staphylococcus muscae]PNZ04491.1 helix-turn-helix domain-containing protein [Staphylococcus muscae]GGA82445.1 hypothetical protein GCM10007183_03320 [Staphylococcus muscae]SNV98327.1 Helix-turn-helix [Staphylococcus muscae]